jgi:hypothetical protein
MEAWGDKKDAKSCGYKFYCNICDYNTCRKSSYDKHLLTAKHEKSQQNDAKTGKKCMATVSYNCKKCEKHYISRNGLWKHNKICKEVTEKELIIMLLKQNAELLQKIGNNNTANSNSNSNNTNTNSNNNNKTFNLQIFLNEDCKNALNISEFVSSIKMDLDDLEKTGRLGYVTGVSNIINKNLSDLDQTMRPIHCSDAKREVFYVKSEDQWIKETDDNKPILTKAIKQIGRENVRQISEWQKKFPDCKDPDSKKNDMYLDIVSNAMSGGSNEEQLHNYEKIITNVAKEVTIEKQE